MICKDIISKLEEIYPKSSAEDWDNPGLLTGRSDRDVRRIFVCLDVTDETLKEAIDCDADMIISHHPLIFGSMRQVNDSTFLGRRILSMVEEGISYYAMHTNFDIKAMADINAKQLQLKECRPLEVTEETEKGPEGLGKIGMIDEAVTLRQMGIRVKEAMHIENIRVYGNLEAMVQKIAVCGGSGKSLIGDAIRQGASVMITGDIDYHSAIDAAAEGLCIIDAGHYGTESCFIPYMEKELKELCPDCCIYTAAIKQPFTVI